MAIKRPEPELLHHVPLKFVRQRVTGHRDSLAVNINNEVTEQTAAAVSQSLRTHEVTDKASFGHVKLRLRSLQLKCCSRDPLRRSIRASG